MFHPVTREYLRRLIPDSRAAWMLLCVSVITALTVSPAFAQSDEEQADPFFTIPPNTPDRLVRASELAIRLRRPDRAAVYLRRLLDLPPTPDDLIGLRNQFGMGPFLKFASREDLQPDAGELLQRINEAAVTSMPTAATMPLLIEQLGGDASTAADAALRMIAVPEVAVPAVLDADRSTREGQLAFELLLRNARRMRHAVTANLSDAAPDTQVRLIEALGMSASPDVAEDLLPYAFGSDNNQVRSAAAAAIARVRPELAELRTASEAAEYLARKAAARLKTAGSSFPSAVENEADDQAAERFRLPGTDPNEDEPELPFGTGLMRAAEHLAGLASSIDSDSPQVDSVTTAVTAAMLSWPPAWSAELETMPAPSGDEQLPEGFEAALDSGNSAAVLGMLAMPEVRQALVGPAAVRLRSLLTFPDRRVQLSAAALAQSLGRQTAGTSDSLNLLRSVASGSLLPEAVIIDPRENAALAAAAVARDLGYEVSPVSSGKAGWERAHAMLRCELILIHAHCIRWPLRNTIANLRSSPVTRRTPIVIYGDARDRQSLRSVSSAYDGVWMIDENALSDVPADPSIVDADKLDPARALSESMRLAGVLLTPLGETQRAAMKQFAAARLAELKEAQNAD